MSTETLPWYKNLISSINTLAEEIGLDDSSTQKLREFIFAQSKEQFKAGNRSGIRWARTNPVPVTA